MPFKYPEARILVFAKAPIAGMVKTRLIPDIGENAAAAFYCDMASTVIDRIAKSQLCPADIYCYPDTTHRFFKDKALKNKMELVSQSGNDLGERMLNAINVSSHQSSNIILVGTDCLEYTDEYFELAIKYLECHDVVVGPATDGGFVLIGMKNLVPGIFKDVVWGDEHVMKTTENNLKRLNQSYKLLTPLNDVDTLEDMLSVSDIEPYKK